MDTGEEAQALQVVIWFLTILDGNASDWLSCLSGQFGLSLLPLFFSFRLFPLFKPHQKSQNAKLKEQILISEKRELNFWKNVDCSSDRSVLSVRVSKLGRHTYVENIISKAIISDFQIFFQIYESYV